MTRYAMATWEPPIPDSGVIFVARCCALMGYIILGSAFLLFFRQMRPVYSICVAILRKAATRNAGDDLDTEASDLVSTLRARVAWYVIVVVGILHVPLTMDTLRTLHNEQVWGDVDVDTMRNGLLEGGIVQVLLRSILWLLLTLRGHCSCHQLHVIQVFLHGDVALRLWFTSDILRYVGTFTVSVLERVFVAFVAGNVPLTIILNAALSCGVFAHVISSSFTNELQYVLRAEVATGVMTVSIAALFESLLFRQMRATLEASLATESERTARELLSLLCDAVVTLDDGLIIKKPSAHLAALLFRDTSQGLCGVDFVELVYDGDGDRFQAFMTNNDCRAQCLHLHLRDTNGTSVSVQLFHSRVRGGLGKTFHLLGIREQEDGERTQRPPAAAVPHRAHPEGDICSRTLRAAAAEDRSCHDTVSLISSASGSSDSPEIAFTVDAASARLTLMSCTLAFTVFSGPVLHGTAVLNWVDDDGARKLSSLVHRASNGATSGYAHVVFNVPHSRCAGKFRARCSAHLVAQDSDDGKVCVRVTLSSVQVRGGRRRTTSNTGTQQRVVRRLSL